MEVATLLIPVQSVKTNRVIRVGAEVELLEQDVVMSGDKNLYAEPLKLQKHLCHFAEYPRIQISLRLIPEQDGACEERAVSYQQPKQTELPHTFSK